MAFRKLGPDVKERLLEAVRRGATYELACLYAGVSEDSLARYRRHAEFADDLRKAEGQAVLKWLTVIDDAAADGEWTAAAWKLERRYPHAYGRRALEVTGRDGGAIPLAVVPFDYADAVAVLGAAPDAPALAPGPNGHRAPPGQAAGRGDGPPLGEDPDGG